MTDGSLTPTLALAYLRELSLDVHSAVVLDASGGVRAGDAELAARARSLLGERADAGSWSVQADGETVVLARAADGTAIVLSAGDQALLPLIFHDLTAILAAVADRPPATT